MVTRQDVVAALDRLDRVPARRPDLKSSAVAITLVTDDAGIDPTVTGAGDNRPVPGPPAPPIEPPADARSAYGGAGFLLTRRAGRLRGHPGQWALPGGRAEPGESPGQTARRELAEELGLELGPDAELGLLDDYPTRSGYVITPVVLWAGAGARPVPNPAEVGELHRIPLGQIDLPPRFLAIPESTAPVVQLPLFGRFVHAPTGAVLYQFREVVLHGRATRVAHLEQPVFAWR